MRQMLEKSPKPMVAREVVAGRAPRGGWFCVGEMGEEQPRIGGSNDGLAVGGWR